MPKTITKRIRLACERFQRTVLEFITSKGATPGSFYDFEIETKAGNLHLTPYDTWVACRFDDVERARTIVGNDGRLNRCSGKWNFHFSHDEIATPAALTYFAQNLEAIL